MLDALPSVSTLLARFVQRHAGAGRLHSLRYVQQDTMGLSVSRNIIDPPRLQHNAGVMLCVRINGNEAFVATSDLTERGLTQAFEQAQSLATAMGAHALLKLPSVQGEAMLARYASPGADLPLPDASVWLDILRAESARVPAHQQLVNWSAGLRVTDRHQLYLDSVGSEIHTHQRVFHPRLEVTAFDGRHSQRRSWSFSRQGGPELVRQSGFIGHIEQVADQALQLLAAPNTPSGERDVLLMPDQMILQIHESIGHPLEMDRILGDERNFAGTSFVTPDMFGSYQYGSPLLNVSFDPDITDEAASYGHDDEGLPAHKHLLIEGGVLKRPLGGALSQSRSGLPGVANSRACDWNRPPIDRMANLNLEPGDQDLAQMIGNIEHGILMATNRSWSIDQARNKFQFGCEWGQLIENGQLTKVVRNPNYRGISAQFWRKLSAVGDTSTFEVLGTPNCGKGEPNQSITVGHATPACVFQQIDVFGGQA